MTLRIHESALCSAPSRPTRAAASRMHSSETARRRIRHCPGEPARDCRQLGRGLRLCIEVCLLCGRSYACAVDSSARAFDFRLQRQLQLDRAAQAHRAEGEHRPTGRHTQRVTRWSKGVLAARLSWRSTDSATVSSTVSSGSLLTATCDEFRLKPLMDEPGPMSFVAQSSSYSLSPLRCRERRVDTAANECRSNHVESSSEQAWLESGQCVWAG